MSSANRIPSEPYGSVRDLPSYKEMIQLAQGTKFLACLIAREKRHEIKQLEAKINELIGTVDAFYDRLGQRNWIFHDSLSPDKIRALLASTTDPVDAERGLIEMYQDHDTMYSWVKRLQCRPLLRERAHQIERAYEHFCSGHYDSCVLHLIAVMDGYVSDLEPSNRRGQHARAPEEMQAWDSVVGHHLGLTHAMKAYHRVISKRIDDPVFELHRHGIVHGMVVNFDNVIVAAKAWNMLFAVNDYAASLERAARPVEPTPTLSQTFRRLAKYVRQKKAKERFVPFTSKLGDPGFADIDAVKAAEAFLNDWQHRRWGRLAKFMPPHTSRSRSQGKLAGETKEEFSPYLITDYEVIACSHDHLLAANLKARVVHDGAHRTIQFRMAFFGEGGDLDIPGEDPGEWLIAVWAPHLFFQDPES